MKVTLITTAVLIVALAVLLNTRFGVFIVFDVLGDVGTDNLELDSAKGPLRLNHAIIARKHIQLPLAIEQASGIHVTTNRIYLSTDQAELFELNDAGEIINQASISPNAVICRPDQGHLMPWERGLRGRFEYVFGRAHYTQCLSTIRCTIGAKWAKSGVSMSARFPASSR